MTGASAWSVALVGMEGSMVEVEAAISSGLPRTVLVGLPDAALHEARDRCRAAVCATGLSWPSNVLTINLTPAGLPKAGTHFDLAIAAATLAADGKVPQALLGSTVLIGELGLDGRVRPVRGVLPALLAAREAGFERAVVPASQSDEASLVEGLMIWPVGHLGDVVDVLHGRPVVPPEGPIVGSPDTDPGIGDLTEVIGQHEARRALEVAAAGRHHILLRGAPGCGKSMLARRLPGILPRLDHRDALEVTALHSLAGRGSGRLMTRPPLAQPHHSVSMAAMVGGGVRIAQPGAISLAHRGCCFSTRLRSLRQRCWTRCVDRWRRGKSLLDVLRHTRRSRLGFSLLWRSIRARVGWPMTHRDGARALRNRFAGIQVGFRARS